MDNVSIPGEPVSELRRNRADQVRNKINLQTLRDLLDRERLAFAATAEAYRDRLVWLKDQPEIDGKRNPQLPFVTAETVARASLRAAAAFDVAALAITEALETAGTVEWV